MAKKKKPRRVVVKWVDSIGPAGGYWKHLDDFDPRPPVITTRGFLIKKGKSYVVIASSVSRNDVSPGGIISIPKCSILKCRTKR